MSFWQTTNLSNQSKQKPKLDEKVRYPVSFFAQSKLKFVLGLTQYDAIPNVHRI